MGLFRKKEKKKKEIFLKEYLDFYKDISTGHIVHVYMPTGDERGNKQHVGIFTDFSPTRADKNTIRVFGIDTTNDFIVQDIRHYSFRNIGKPFWLDIKQKKRTIDKH